MGSGAPVSSVTSTETSCFWVMVEISLGTSKENPVPAVVVSLGTETATNPTVDVSGRSSKSTVRPGELPDALGSF